MGGRTVDGSFAPVAGEGEAPMVKRGGRQEGHGGHDDDADAHDGRTAETRG